jgi:hypothetical protein
LYLVEEFLKDELCGVHDGVEETGEEDDLAVCACREEVVSASCVAAELVIKGDRLGIFASTAWGCSARASAPAAPGSSRQVQHATPPPTTTCLHLA